MHLNICRIIIVAALIACFVFPIAGCKSSPNTKDLEKRLKSLAGFYNDNVRWKRFERAVRYIPEQDRKSFLETQERNRELLNVTETRIIDVYLGKEDQTKGTVLVWYTYYKWPDNRVKKELFEQSWNYNTEEDWWYIDYRATDLADTEK